MTPTLRMMIACSLIWAAAIPAPAAEQPPLAPSTAPVPLRDGSRDFDWEIGRWTTVLRYLPEPLTGSNRWLDYRGTSEVRGVLGGRANLVVGTSLRRHGYERRYEEALI